MNPYLDALAQHAVRANVCASSNYLRNGSKAFEQQVQRDAFLVVGAEYSLELSLSISLTVCRMSANKAFSER